MSRKNKMVIQKPYEIEINENVLIPKYIPEVLENKFVKQFDEGIPHLRTLSGQDRALLDYFLTIMNFENVINTSPFILNEYISLVRRNGTNRTTPSLQSLRRNIKRLIDAEILIDFGRSIKVVNPKFFFKASEEDRANLLKGIYELQLKARAKEITKKIEDEENKLDPEIEDFINQFI
jgi:hypothetical protein